MMNWMMDCDDASSWTSWTSCWWLNASASVLSQNVVEIGNGVEVSGSEIWWASASASVPSQNVVEIGNGVEVSRSEI